MYNSLLKHCPNFRIFIVCLDDKLYDFLQNKKYDFINPINLSEIEMKYPELLIAKNNRTYVEYIFTLSPVLALYVLENYKNIDKITTLDADLYFFSDPTFLINNNYSIVITPHNFKKSLSKLIKYGKYNVSFQTFKNDETGLACLKKWKDDCIEWCYDKYDGNRYADQKYLDKWLNEYNSLNEYGNGTGIAPWNIKNKDISITKDGVILIKNTPIVYYHFHGLRDISENLYSIGLVDYRVVKRNKIVKLLYAEYIAEIKRNSFFKSTITRRMHPKLGRLVYLFFLADLYKYNEGRLRRVFNLNFLRMLYSYINSLK
jgi:hypothetical protein